MFEPLNQLLFGKLRTRFGSVKVANAGEALMGDYRPSLTRNDRDDFVVQHTGEYYMVCCPKCHDTRHRLWVNHRWGVRDKYGNRNLWMAVCFNEGCFSDYEDRLDLFDDLNELSGMLDRAIIKQGKEIDFANIEVTLPGPVTRLCDLPPDHHANVYLAGRGYNPEQLGSFYGVGYCSNSMHYLAQNRIMVPIYKDKVLKGWQARHIGDMNWKDPASPPKWYTMPGFKKGQTFYNIDTAKQFNTGVVVEGCGDVWGLGPMGLASFGDSLSTTQKRTLPSLFGNGSCVLLHDPEAMDPLKHAERLKLQDPDTPPSKLLALERRKEKLDDLCTELSSKFRHGFAPVVLPWGKDPGSLDRGYMRDYITREAKAMGVKVSWKRK